MITAVLFEPLTIVIDGASLYLFYATVLVLVMVWFTLMMGMLGTKTLVPPPF